MAQHPVIPRIDIQPTGRVPHAVMNPDAPAFVDGKPTPEAERAFGRFTDWMIAEANKTPDPGVTLARIVAALPEVMADAWAAVQARRTTAAPA